MSVSETESPTVAQSAACDNDHAGFMDAAGSKRYCCDALLIVGVLCVLVMIGLFLTNVSHLHARYYWSAMFPIFGIVSLWHELNGPRRQTRTAVEADPAAGAALARTDRRGADNFSATRARANGR